MLRRRFLLASLVLTAVPLVAHADEASPQSANLDATLDKLEQHAAQFEKMKRRASYTLTGTKR